MCLGPLGALCAEPDSADLREARGLFLGSAQQVQLVQDHTGV